MIFAESNEKPFAEFEGNQFPHRDSRLGILFETDRIWEDSIILLRFNCPDPLCDVACRNWSALKAHVKAAHHRYLWHLPLIVLANPSSLCTQYKKVFSHEHILYTSRELSTHFATGDPVKDVSLTGFTGHPKCKSCNQSFYSLDEFTQHNREKHERCHVCDRVNSHRGVSDTQPRYFINYDELWKHFSSDHFPCGAPECLEQRFVVFESEIDLKAHIMEAHMGRASKAELRDMRRVEANFQYSTLPGGRRRRDDDRLTREVDISSLPRDEQAYFRIQQAQREMASRQIGNITIPPVRPRDGVDRFPPLSSSAPSSSSTLAAPARSSVDNFPPLGGARTSSTPAQPQHSAPSNLPPEVAARHAAVLERAGALLNNDAEKLAQFKSQVSAFRHSEITANELMDRLWDIFNAKLDEFGKLITSTADLFDYDAKSRRTELLGAWNDWKIQVIYTCLGDTYGQMQEANSAASTGSLPQNAQRARILTIKSAAKNRPSTSTQSVWNRIEAVAASKPVPSPPIPQRLNALNLSSATRATVPWTSASTSSAPAPRLTTVRPSPSQAPGRTASLEEFPSLPTSKPRERIVLNAAHAPARPVASWGSDSRTRTRNDNVQETSEAAKGKGKKKGKTVLFHVG